MRNLRLVAALGKHASLGTPFQPCLCNKSVGLERESKEKKWRIKVRKKINLGILVYLGFKWYFEAN